MKKDVEVKPKSDAQAVQKPITPSKSQTVADNTKPAAPTQPKSTDTATTSPTKPTNP